MVDELSRYSLPHPDVPEIMELMLPHRQHEGYTPFLHELVVENGPRPGFFDGPGEQRRVDESRGAAGNAPGDGGGVPNQSVVDNIQIHWVGEVLHWSGGAVRGNRPGAWPSFLNRLPISVLRQ